MNITTSQIQYEIEQAKLDAAADAKMDFVNDYVAKRLPSFMDDQELVREAIENAPESLTVALNNILANLAKGNAKIAQNQLQAVLADIVDWRLTEMAVEEWEKKNA